MLKKLERRQCAAGSRKESPCNSARAARGGEVNDVKALGKNWGHCGMLREEEEPENCKARGAALMGGAQIVQGICSKKRKPRSDKSAAQKEALRVRQSEPSATTSTKSGEMKPISKRTARSVLGESVRADCSSLAVVGQATQAAAIAMPKVESGIPTFEVT